MNPVEFVNIIKIRGIVESVREVWRGDKGALFEVVLKVGETEKRDLIGVMSFTDKLVETKGFGVGATVQISGELTARLGKESKWWGQATARKVEVIQEAPENKQVKATSELTDDDIPW